MNPLPRGFSRSPATRFALLWLALFAAVGVALVMLYPDSYQQDGGMHYLFARWAWKHQMNFVSVWGRPLFTFLYAFPALLGYPAAKLFTVVISLVLAWQTWRLAQQLELARAELVIPFLFLQPSMLLLCADTMTEPLFALVFVIALRLHLHGRVPEAMAVASLLPLTRPEGFFIAALWGWWVVFDARGEGDRWQRARSRIPSTLLLASGMFLWWFVALWIMNDPLWLWHNWPQDWNPAGGQYGSADIWWYFHKSSQIFGLVLKGPFVIGLLLLLWQRSFRHGVAAFLLIFTLHALLFVHGSFNAAGYPRYFVCIAPVIALITLAGWNGIADVLMKVSRFVPAAAVTIMLVLSGIHSLHYVDGWGFMRDARGDSEMYQWFRTNAVGDHPINNLFWSQSYMCILFDRDVWEKPMLSGDRQKNLAILHYAPPGTLAFWDQAVGTGWHTLTPADFEAAGYVRLRSQAYQFDGWFFAMKWQKHGGPSLQELHLFYKPPPDQPPGQTAFPPSSYPD